MPYRVAADLVLLLHLLFVLFVGLGGLLALRWRRLAWIHLPVLAWGIAISVGRWICPLTPLEIWLRRRGGGTGYEGGFIERYIVPVVYPPGLTAEMQYGLAALLLVANAWIYWRLFGVGDDAGADRAAPRRPAPTRGRERGSRGAGDAS